MIILSPTKKHPNKKRQNESSPPSFPSSPPFPSRNPPTLLPVPRSSWPPEGPYCGPRTSPASARPWRRWMTCEEPRRDTRGTLPCVWFSTQTEAFVIIYIYIYSSVVAATLIGKNVLMEVTASVIEAVPIFNIAWRRGGGGAGHRLVWYW